MSLTTLTSLPPEIMAKIASYGTLADMTHLTGMGLVDKGGLLSELEPQSMSYKDLVRLSHLRKVEAHLRKVAAALRARVPDLPQNIPDSALTAAAYHLLCPDGRAGLIPRDIDLIHVRRPKKGKFQFLSSPRDTIMIEHNRRANTSSISFFKGRKLYRIDGPARRDWDAHGALFNETWMPQREDRPSHRVWYSNGDLLLEEWFNIDGKPHRVGGPAVTHMLLINGVLHKTEEWYEHGKLHRVDGPALTHFRPLGDDTIQKTEGWYLQGALQRRQITTV